MLPSAPGIRDRQAASEGSGPVPCSPRGSQLHEEDDMGQRKLDGTEEQPVWSVVRSVKTETSEKVGDTDDREDVTRTRKIKWTGEAGSWMEAIEKACSDFEMPEDSTLTLTVKRVGT